MAITGQRPTESKEEEEVKEKREREKKKKEPVLEGLKAKMCFWLQMILAVHHSPPLSLSLSSQVLFNDRTQLPPRLPSRPILSKISSSFPYRRAQFCVTAETRNSFFTI